MKRARVLLADDHFLICTGVGAILYQVGERVFFINSTAAKVRAR
jgi:hypothetical protein